MASVLSVNKNTNTSTLTIVIQLEGSENFSVQDVTHWLDTLKQGQSRKPKTTSPSKPVALGKMTVQNFRMDDEIPDGFDVV